MTLTDLLDYQDYTLLEEADINSNGEMSAFLNRKGLSHWTVCPYCKVDDFTHAGDCERP